MNTLPFDYTRCTPMPTAADKCHDCARFAHLPGQTWGPMTPHVLQRGFPEFLGCRYVPLEFLGVRE